MSIVFAGLSPHPPILIPEIGGEDAKKVQKTADALLELSEKLNIAEPETIIIISPHGLVYPDRMNVCGIKKLFGSFEQFKHPELKFNYLNNLDLANKIDHLANKEGIETLLYHNNKTEFELDHGILVPLYFLQQKLDSPIKIIPIAYSFQSRADHFTFGQIIAGVCKKAEERIAVIASGDLSHRLFPQSFMDNTKTGIKFDKKLFELIETNNIRDILDLDEELVQEAGECGYHSLLILLGTIEKLNYQPKVLSYEGPFGVGYLVADFQINFHPA
jgi:aromatic ring-opening dioxygenase LigB subunit